jgi:hypothetical protein
MKYDILLMTKGLVTTSICRTAIKGFCLFQEITCVLFNAHYPISLRSKEKELIRMFEIVLGRGKWTCLKQNGKEQVKNIHTLTPHA